MKVWLTNEMYVKPCRTRTSIFWNSSYMLLLQTSYTCSLGCPLESSTFISSSDIPAASCYWVGSRFTVPCQLSSCSLLMLNTERPSPWLEFISSLLFRLNVAGTCVDVVLCYYSCLLFSSRIWLNSLLAEWNELSQLWSSSAIGVPKSVPSWSESAILLVYFERV